MSRVMLSRFAPLRIALSGAKGLTVNFAKQPVLLEAIFMTKADSSLRSE